MTLRTVALVLALNVSAQAQSTPVTQQLPDAPSTTSQLKPPSVPTGPTAVIDTTMGRLTCKLFEKEAPVTVANFIGLAEGTKDWTDPKTLQKMRHQPFYNGTTFHRVIPTFMIQGGDRVGDGSGDPGYFFQDEIDLSHLRPARSPRHGQRRTWTFGRRNQRLTVLHHGTTCSST
jgi:peptidyl-prolyl cis-trans isomerase A (cyclophilin A)